MRNVTLTIRAPILVAGLSASAVAEEPPLKVFVLAGQRNRAGEGADVAQLADDLRQPH